jgi:hypothetical protein
MASEVYKSFLVLNASEEFLAGSSCYITAMTLFIRLADLLVLSLQLLQACSGLAFHLKVHFGGLAWALTLLAFALLCGMPHSSHSSLSTAFRRHLLAFLM